MSAAAPRRYFDAIRASGLGLYDAIAIDDRRLWIPTSQLEALIDCGLRGLRLAGLPLRTRSKVVKTRVCEVLGYEAPASFKRTRPRFPGQMFDVYIQKSDNLQIFNEDIAASRRYVIVRVSEADVVTRVRVVTGDRLAQLDTTGTLTHKYQARCIPGRDKAELICAQDTRGLRPLVAPAVDLRQVTAPTLLPVAREILSIDAVFARLSPLLGRRFPNAGADQERNRGAALHALVCKALGYRHYQDDGKFPDVRHQLLEVKLQTSPTIDLGLVAPDSTALLDMPAINRYRIRHCDVRYAVFHAAIVNGQVELRHLFVTTGEAFFTRFARFGGKGRNAKLQIPLPRNFFDA